MRSHNLHTQTWHINENEQTFHPLGKITYKGGCAYCDNAINAIDLICLSVCLFCSNIRNSVSPISRISIRNEHFHCGYLWYTVRPYRVKVRILP